MALDPPVAVVLRAVHAKDGAKVEPKTFHDVTLADESPSGDNLGQR